MKILRKLILSLGIAFLILIIFLLVTFAVVKNLKIKEIVEHEIESSLGINVTIDKIDFSPFLAHVGAQGVTIHNPSGFEENELAYIESIHFMLDPIEILTLEKPNIYLLTLDLKRLNIIKNKDGRVNIKEILPLAKGDEKKSDETPFYFDVIVLSVGEVTYTEHTSAGVKTRPYQIGIKNEAFVDLKDENDVTKLIIYRAIQNTDIGKLVNLTIVPVVSQVSDTVSAAWGLAKTGAKGMGEIAAMPFKFLFGKN